MEYEGLILADLVDLAVHRFKHGGDPSNLRCLWELSELIGGHGQVGAWGLVDVMAINLEEFFIEVAMEGPSLQVKLVITSGLGHRKGALVIIALCTVDVPVFTSGTFLIGFTIPGGLSMLTLKIAPPQKGERGGCSMKVSARVSMEP